jgi:CRP-like cAMP-binding protein
MALPKVSHRATNARVRSDGHRVRNSILLGLPADECDAVFKKLEFVELPTNFVLQEAGPIKFAYFINSGLASVLDGKNVEVGLAGKEGFVGQSLANGFSTSPRRVIMKVRGSAYRMTATDFAKALSHSANLAKNLNRFATHSI